MRLCPKQHQCSCGIDVHARTMSLCILHQAGEMLVHQHRQASPETWLRTRAPYREDVVVAVAWIFTWYWRADRCAQEGMPFVLGHALSMPASHGGKAKNDTSDAQKIAVLLRGGLLRRSERPESPRVPRGQDVVSSCRLVQCATASAGTRDGPSGAKSGHASLTWAFSAAAVLFLRAHPAGQQYLDRLEKKPGQGTALTV